MAFKIYDYKNCDTCRKALKYLDSKGVKYERLPIVETPPTLEELQKMLAALKVEGGNFKNLFNTSGQLYRELEITQKLKDGMSESEALRLLAKNGKLIKRPFLLGTKGGLVGFKQDQWSKFLS